MEGVNVIEKRMQPGLAWPGLGILQTYPRTIISIITLQTTGEMEHKYENIRRAREKISTKIMLLSFVDI